MAENCTYIDGISSTVSIDTAGEIVDLAGIDCYSLIGAALNWEHKADIPAQIVGKILEYKKIFSEQDIENDRHQYYWDKCKTPYLYVMGRLFDDKKDSSKECAALFIDDAEHPDEHPMVGFSIEGSKVDKKGLTVTKSIARKITITAANANKQCVAELIPADSQKTDPNSIFKTEATFCIELFKSESMEKSAPSWSPGKKVDNAVHFSHPEHGTVSIHKQPNGEFHVKHQGALAGLSGQKGKFRRAEAAGQHAKIYMQAVSQKKVLGPKMHDRSSPQMVNKSNSHMNKGVIGGIGMGGGLPPESTDKKNKRGLFNPDVDKITGKTGIIGGMGMGGIGRSEHKGNLKKALTAGSGMAAPGNLTGGAVLGKESLDKKMKKTEPKKGNMDTGEKPIAHRTPFEMKSGQGYNIGHKSGQMATYHRSTPAAHHFSVGGKTIKIKREIKKSESLLRAEQEYTSWAKREEFEAFMAKSMPELAKGEVRAIGQVLCLSKSMKIEKKLAKMVTGSNLNSFVEKKEK